MIERVEAFVSSVGERRLNGAISHEEHMLCSASAFCWAQILRLWLRMTI